MDRIVDEGDKFGYEPAVERLFAAQDPEFLVKMMKISDKKMLNLPSLGSLAKHYKHILQNGNFKDCRCQLIAAIKNLITGAGKYRDSVVNYILKPMDTDLIEIFPH